MNSMPQRASYDSDKAFAEATDIFSAAFNNHLLNFGSITNFRRVVKTGVPLAKDHIAQQDLENILSLLADPDSRQIFRDPERLVANGKHFHMAQEQTRMSIATAESTIEAASLVFAHAVLDATLFDFCRTCAVAFPYDWTPFVERRKVSFQEIGQMERFDIFNHLLDDYLTQLEKESLLKKADILHQVTALDDKIRTAQHYKYSRERLGKIDATRHRIVHGLEFKDKVGDVESDIDYLLRTGFYFLSIVNQKYNLKIDPGYSMRTAQQSPSPGDSPASGAPPSEV